MNKGAVWRIRGKKRLRLRRATTRLSAGDRIELFYDEAILKRVPQQAELLCDGLTFSAWHKPAGLLFSGTDFGDHASLLRQAERFFPRRWLYPIHRLDREVEGLCVVAHTARAAADLSAQFREQRVDKRYRAQVRGDLSHHRLPMEINRPIDGKAALSQIHAVSFDPERDISQITVSILTGRKHQIRRHLEMIGHPVMGDPVYGKGNKNKTGLKLRAVGLAFRCPGRSVEVRLDLDELIGADGTML
jgi:tRNA pseudouridine32 synthase/23S rRNA pseudouridine746 synthase